VNEPARSDASKITYSLLSHADELAAEINAAAVFAYGDALPGDDWECPEGLARRLLLVARGEEEREALEEKGTKGVIVVPSQKLTRMGQVKVAVLLALARGLLKPGDGIVCLTGIARSGSLDMLLVTEVGREFEVFLAPSAGEAIVPYLHPSVLSRIMAIAVALGSEGREGKPVGTLFVLGDTEKVVPLTHQMILNPFYGYKEEERNILDPRLEETIKELATVDGAFIIRGDGVIESSGTYLKTSAFPEEGLPSGLGARHQAAAGISFVTDCIAVSVSQSTGTVTVFRNGKIVTALEKPPSVTKRAKS
jgi:DNA integrity scanning protein DisA with diadenylate cyclase activity